MATKFPKFSQALAQDPATRRIWWYRYCSRFRRHDGMTEENYIKDFRFTFRSLAVIFLWTAGLHVQGNFETWVTNPLKVKPIAHAIWDPHW
jgi:photosystem I P700 chlorophyll a apoprotein A2